MLQAWDERRDHHRPDGAGRPDEERTVRQRVGRQQRLPFGAHVRRQHDVADHPGRERRGLSLDEIGADG